MKVVSVVGARPQFVKAAPVSDALRQKHQEILVHTGQHYDDEMSAIFFRELDIPEPDYDLDVGSGSHGWQTGEMLARIEKVLLVERPDLVLVYGDTNSTLAGALAAVKLLMPVAHIEAGLRSFNLQMPEEHNRVLTDHCATLLFCPTKTAVDNLAREGIDSGVYLVGDVMVDAAKRFGALALEKSTILRELNLTPQNYLLATVHRASSTDDPARLAQILAALGAAEETVVFPAHPRTRKQISRFGFKDRILNDRNIRLIDPVGYLDMLMLEQNARLILTDSGGVQKEAYFFSVPCVTLRAETEWTETVESGWNILVGASYDRILTAIHERSWPAGVPPTIFGQGDSASLITAKLEENL